MSQKLYVIKSDQSLGGHGDEELEVDWGRPSPYELNSSAVVLTISG